MVQFFLFVYRTHERTGVIYCFKNVIFVITKLDFECYVLKYYF